MEFVVSSLAVLKNSEYAAITCEVSCLRIMGGNGYYIEIINQLFFLLNLKLRSLVQHSL